MPIIIVLGKLKRKITSSKLAQARNETLSQERKEKGREEKKK